MSKAPASKPDPGRPGLFLHNGAAAKAGLNRSINDAGWGVAERTAERTFVSYTPTAIASTMPATANGLISRNPRRP
ncbi:hypothetical protein M2283_009347 [Streptomyces pseudovenezuelae]|uniref:Uncharacterized protein n=1 Tax=Streptomyces pseudovenezuelae TaxID=67350 RepID=A0ABT6M0B7_9ACTN|nr:hypothetical protein [Streptomyces pseudovenezuelae]